MVWKSQHEGNLMKLASEVSTGGSTIHSFFKTTIYSLVHFVGSFKTLRQCTIFGARLAIGCPGLALNSLSNLTV